MSNNTDIVVYWCLSVSPLDSVIILNMRILCEWEIVLILQRNFIHVSGD